MEIFFTFLITVAATAAVAWVMTRSLRQRTTRLEADCRHLSKRLAEATASLDNKNNEILRLTGDNASLATQLHALESKQTELEKQSRETFSNLASEILNKQNEAFNRDTKQRLDSLLAPLQQRLDDFGKQVERYGHSHVESTARLEGQLKILRELNRSIGSEAHRLTNALRSNVKVQGDWGEVILEQILNMSGLREGDNYLRQATRQNDGSLIVNEDGQRLRPDVVLFTPDRQKIIIDSKVSLTAFTDYVNEEDPQLAAQALERHVTSVKNHINELVERDYAAHVEGALPFVMMFIPNEPAYLAAMTHRRDLWDYAYKHRVIIVSPTHLMSVLQLLMQLWERDKQSRNALEIARRGGELYDKLAAFVNDMADIDKALTRAHDAYNNAFNKLSTGRGNLIKRAEDLRQLGIKASKQLPNS